MSEEDSEILVVKDIAFHEQFCFRFLFFGYNCIFLVHRKIVSGKVSMLNTECVLIVRHMDKNIIFIIFRDVATGCNASADHINHLHENIVW